MGEEGFKCPAKESELVPVAQQWDDAYCQGWPEGNGTAGWIKATEMDTHGSCDSMSKIKVKAWLHLLSASGMAGKLLSSLPPFSQGPLSLHGHPLIRTRVLLN